MTRKGLYKLIFKPHLFARDYLRKKQHKMAYILPKRKVIGQEKYTVVSAVYGVEKYLDDYFKSLVYQTLDFKKHIFLVLVDDGSLDNSANIIKKWQKKYPDNILYLKKENGGQASARNYGLDYLKTEWVTFIDPDDFVSLDYFEEIDNFLVKYKNKNFSMISNNFIFYYEDKGKYSDTHPLKYRFNDDKILNVNNLNGHIQLSVNSALFKLSVIKNNMLAMKSEIKPSLEDGEFNMRYLLYSDSKSYVGFLKKPKYFYRKRSDGTSTLDTGWINKKAYSDVLQLACIDVFEEALKIKGYVPKEFQKTVLYHLSWQIKRIVNNSSSLSFLNEEEISLYKKLLKNIFIYIDREVIESFNLAGVWFYHKVALLGMQKDIELDYQIVYVEDYDDIKNEVKVRYFSYFDSTYRVLVDNKEILPTHHKIRRHEFLGDKFVDEYIAWLPIENGKKLDIFVDNKATRISFKGKHHHNGVSTNEIISYFSKKLIDVNKLPLQIKAKRKLYTSTYYQNKYKNAWLLMDRDTQADDNAEHLYRYIQKNHPEINIFFVLRKNSHDWDRLKKDNFRLINLGSIEHESALIHAKHMIASDASKNNINYLENRYYKDLLSYRFTFLQHGVIQNDLSKWLNTKKIDCFVTTAQREYNTIARDNNKYKFTSKEVLLTGLPRHDFLIEQNHIDSKTIMIMPTWRESLNQIGKDETNFKATLFASSWSIFLNSDTLYHLYKNKNYKFILFPHPNLLNFLEYLEIPSFIEVIRKEKKSIQYYFQNSSLLITDYSSVAFEMGILKKQTIYYQFDFEEIFSGMHTFEKGYFDYKKDGFGPVCYEEQDLLKELKRFVENNEKVESKYLERMKNFFAFQDINNCKRTYDAIVALDKPYNEKIDKLSLQHSIDEAYKNEKWKLVESLYEKLEDKNDEYRLMLVESKLNLGQIEEANEIFETIERDDLNLAKITESKKRVYNFVLLSREEQALLVNKNMDFFTTLRFDYIKKLFNDKKYNVCLVAFELFNIKNIPKAKESEFYYMWGKTLKVLKKNEESFEKFLKALKFDSEIEEEILKNIILLLEDSNDKSELEAYRNRLLKLKFWAM